jgi:Ni2+-binding GTPase involved in maturation of urease and hydrogenase
VSSWKNAVICSNQYVFASLRVDLNIERVKFDVRKLNKKIEIFPISTKTGEGMTQWYDWLLKEAEHQMKFSPAGRPAG